MDPRLELALALATMLINSGLLTAGALAVKSALARRFGAERAATVTTLAGEAVRATEQIAQRTGWDSQAKYQNAAIYLHDLAKTHNISLDTGEVAILLESAVHAMKSAGAAFEQPTVNVTAVTPQDIAGDIHAALQPLLAAPVTSAAKPLAVDDDALPAKAGEHHHVPGQLA
jgi:hypothetical protein